MKPLHTFEVLRSNSNITMGEIVRILSQSEWLWNDFMYSGCLLATFSSICHFQYANNDWSVKQNCLLVMIRVQKSTTRNKLATYISYKPFDHGIFWSTNCVEYLFKVSKRYIIGPACKVLKYRLLHISKNLFLCKRVTSRNEGKFGNYRQSDY